MARKKEVLEIRRSVVRYNQPVDNIGVTLVVSQIVKSRFHAMLMAEGWFYTDISIFFRVPGDSKFAGIKV